MVGATLDDVLQSRQKVEIAKRMILGLCKKPDLTPHFGRWEEVMGWFYGCDIVFGCLDGLEARRGLEAALRRNLVPLIDVGLHVEDGAPPQMSGQIITSIPGQACMHCLGFINETSLASEMQGYGATGPRPQVVWANGNLASAAVGIAVDLLTGWSGRSPTLHLLYDGNLATIAPHPTLKYVAAECMHYEAADIGEPFYQPTP